jgi:hypothetical protein
MRASLSDCYAELQTLTGIGASDWRDLLSLPPDVLEMTVQTYRNADWTKNADTFGQVLVVLGVIGSIAGVVSGVAGAAGAVAALKSL